MKSVNNRKREKSSHLRLGLVFFPIACVLLYFLPLDSLFDGAALAESLHRWGRASFGGFILVYILLTAIGIPGTVMTVAGGTVFGLVWGTLLSVVGATLGAMAAFFIARYFLRNWAERHFRRHKTLHRFDRAVRKHPWSFVFIVRFAPISPFNLVNFLFGLTSVRWVPYSIATLVGIIPGTLAYTWLGVTGGEAIAGGDRGPFLLALGAIALLSALPMVISGKNRSG